jgi:hypothetical protein
MKKVYIFIGTILLTTGMFASNLETITRTVFSQNFEKCAFGPAAPFDATDTLGGLDFQNLGAQSVYSRSLTTAAISGTKSLKLDLTTVGEWWTIQVRIETPSVAIPIDFKAGYSYRMTYKIRSTVPETIIHFCHFAGVMDSQENVSLVGGGVVETKTYDSPVLTQSGSADFAWYWALGWPVTPCSITIDDITIQEIYTSPAGIAEHINNINLEAYSTSKQLNIKTATNSKIVVLDLTGRTIAQRNVIANDLATIPMAEKSGVVLVRATDDQGNTSIRKVIIQ